MSEYWVSHKKYFCKYCEIYIADDAPSRRQHETGLRHKGNTERYVRNLYKQGERRKKDLEEEKREMVRVEQAANAAFARDISSGHAAAASSSRLSQAARSASSSKKPERPTSVWSNYTTAQSLGIADPDEERMKAEMEQRMTQGLAGEWVAVAPPPPPLPGEAPDMKEGESKNGVLSGALLPGKREAEAPPEDDDDGRRFKLRKRTLGAGLGEIWDPIDIPIKLKSKAKEEDPSMSPAADTRKSEGTPISTLVGGYEGGQTSQGPAGGKPMWKPMGWKRAAEAQPDVVQVETEQGTDEQQTRLHGEDQSVKEELVPVSIQTSSSYCQRREDPATQDKAMRIEAVQVKLETGEDEIAAPVAPEPTGSLFRKRKVPANGRGRR